MPRCQAGAFLWGWGIPGPRAGVSSVHGGQAWVPGPLLSGAATRRQKDEGSGLWEGQRGCPGMRLPPGTPRPPPPGVCTHVEGHRAVLSAARPLAPHVHPSPTLAQSSSFPPAFPVCSVLGLSLIHVLLLPWLQSHTVPLTPILLRSQTPQKQRWCPGPLLGPFQPSPLSHAPHFSSLPVGLPPPPASPRLPWGSPPGSFSPLDSGTHSSPAHPAHPASGFKRPAGVG